MRYNLNVFFEVLLIFLFVRWPPTASAFVVSFETLEVEGRQSAEGGRSHLMELLKECVF
jgi:hypothetical protein